MLFRSFPIITLVSAFAAFAGQGGAPLASIQLGAGRRDEAERILGNSLVLLLAASLLLTVGFAWMHWPSHSILYKQFGKCQYPSALLLMKVPAFRSHLFLSILTFFLALS